MYFVKYVYRFLLTQLMIVISYVVNVWINIKHMTVKYMAYM